MSTHIRISKNKEALSKDLADWMVNYFTEALKKQNRFTWALSGGSTPKTLYKLLASDIYKNKIDWAKIHFFWGDERFVPFEDKRNNAKMAFDELLNHVPVDKKNIYPIQTMNLQPEEAAAGYENLLKKYFTSVMATFDLVLLGLGNDAHTLSLFPNHAVVKENKNWVNAFYLEQQEMYRITLTAPVVNKARKIVFLVSGEDKAAAMQHVLSNKYEPDLYPAQIIDPKNGELYWFADEAAAAKIL